MRNLGTFIKEKRKAAGLTQKQLAQKIGKAQITVRQYESGARKPGLETKISIANALNFAYDDYLIGVNTEAPTDYNDSLESIFEPVDLNEKEIKKIDDEMMSDPGYLAYLSKTAEEERHSAENGYYDVGTRKVGDRIVNELFYCSPSLSLEGLTEEEIKLLCDYRDFLIWKRGQKQPGNN